MRAMRASLKEKRTLEQLRTAWIDNGNVEPGHERAHGKFETVELHSWQFVKLSQIRGDKNPVTQELKESIVATGLLNPIDVARMTREQLEQYIQFTNETWGAEAEIDDFDAQLMDDGHYYLIVAGHTRHEAIDEAEQEGLLYPIPLMAKVHPVHEVEDIIELQSAENTHSQPRQERGTMAAVEAFNWGKKQGKWSTVDEYIERYTGKNKLDAKGMRDALHFANMPTDVRQFVLSGVMKHTAGVELGKSVDTVRDYLAVKNGYLGVDDMRLADPESEDAILLEKAVTGTLMAKAIYVSGQKLNSTASKKHLEAWRGDMKRFLAKERRQDTKEPEFQILTDMDPRRQLEAYQRGLRRSIGQTLGEMSKRPAAEYATVIQLSQRLVDEGETERLLGDMETSLKKQLRQIGGVAAQEIVEAPEQAMF